ncbi:MAG: CHAT domain-containing protein [Candidatus Eisenbacteria bacterium]|uniref:CHAT domain-containing protein n=1 Tax=Eiseniibacteriota bacterium TaxID=2212470 RepID=A0A538U8S9_UNCEI|nr:MAG: CHAT domain-containing protein [Candidatus Eisenbacteria bacterium]
MDWRSGARCDLLARELRGARGRPAPEQLDLQALRARLLLDQGRTREALDAYQRMGRGGANGWRSVQALTGAARGELGLGRPERAMDRLAEALRAWALDDEMPPELDERDRREAATGALAGLVIDLATGSGADSTDPIRVRAAYDTLQRIRARALIERTLGPQRPAELPIRFALAPLGADSLQRAVLRPGDLLLDVWPGARPPFLFALTRDSVRLARLPSDVTRRAVAFTSAIAAGPSGVDSAAWDSAAARLGASLLGPVADLVRASRRVVIATEGELVTLPWGTLILLDPRAPPAPLAADHEVLQAPSFTWWAATRRTRPELRAARVLALAGPAGENGAATAALAEVEDLGARFRHVDVVSSGHSRLAITPDRLADDDVLQLVTPTRADAFHPWYSGILLEALEVNRDPTWRASDMAGARLRARLVVLPSCAPGGRGTVAGAGIDALATALLSAGADAVVVNRWRVDEGSATRWMEAFYDRLGSGATAAEAFASAEQTMRADPATQAPVHWAGFALIGDGDVKAPLERRPRWWWPAIAAAGILIAALALVVGTRRRARVRALEN